MINLVSKVRQFRNHLLDFLVPPFPVKAKSGPAFFAYAHQKSTLVENLRVCVHIDPQIELLASAEYTNILFGDLEEPESIPSIHIPHRINWIEFLFSLLFLSTDSLRDYRFLASLLKEDSLVPYHWSLFSLRNLLIANYFALKSRKIAEVASEVYVLVYYNAIMLGVVSAFRRVGKNGWDVQHGLIGSSHSAYNNSNAYLIESNLRPTGFLVWSNDIGKYLESTLGVQWRSSNYLHLKHFDRSSYSDGSKKVVLYSLQWDTPVPSEVKQVVRHFKDVQWIFRKHPFESSDRCDPRWISDVQWIFDLPNANVVEAVEPLASALSKSMLHVTVNSSVVFEAAALNVPSMILANRLNSPNIDPYQCFDKPIGDGIACIVAEGELMEVMTKYLEFSLLPSILA
jgi:hypothetical protein